MKIGIVTFWSSKDNYGQLLQLFALQTFLKELGHEPFLIRYAFWKDNSIPKLFKEYFLLPWRIPRAIKNKIAERKVHKSNIVHERKFVDFLSENILYTEQIYSTKELINNPPIADCYITGSDQVWGALTPNPVFFLQFGAKEIKRISFAASFGDGNDFFKDRYISKVTPYLNKFDMVTVREYKALDVCKKAGINGCILFPDPTLLIDMSNYNRLLFSNLSTDKYCLVYMLEGEEKTKMSMDDIVAFVKDMGAKMIYVASQGRFDKYAKQYPTIPQFLSYIKNADFVITGEGRLDGQTVMGKAPIGVAEIAKKHKKKVLAFGGCVAEDATLCNQHGIDAFFPILRTVTTLKEAMDFNHAKENLSAAVEQVFRLIQSFE